jgi:hypothetical protein
MKKPGEMLGFFFDPAKKTFRSNFRWPAFIKRLLDLRLFRQGLKPASFMALCGAAEGRALSTFVSFRNIRAFSKHSCPFKNIYETRSQY